MLRNPVLWGSLLSCLTPLLFAQNPVANGNSDPPGITTDRPAITDSSAIVPRSVFQVENGFLDTGGQPRNTLDFPETLLRFGMTSHTELRLTVPDYYRNAFPSAPQSGFGDPAIGLKQQLLTGNLEVAAIVTLSLPAGANAISSHGYDPSFQLPWSHKLSENWTVAGMLSLYVPTRNGSHAVTGESTFLVDRQLTKPWDVFIEYAGDFPQDGGPSHLLHFGTAYKIASRQQLDLHGGIGLSAAAVDHFIGIGYSFCFSLAKSSAGQR